MDLFAYPVTVAGLVSFVALGAWAMGRLQGPVAIPGDAAALPGTRLRDGQAHSGVRANPATETPSALRGAGPNLQGERSKSISALELVDSLGDLHEEVTAFRRQERVFATLAPDLLLLSAMSDYAATGLGQTGATDWPGGPMFDCDDQRASYAADGFVVTSSAPLVWSDDRLNRRQRFRS